MTFTKTIKDELLGLVYKTTIYNDQEVLRGSRLVNGKLLTITTCAPITTMEYSVRANNMCSLSNKDFTLLSDCDLDEAEGYE